MSPSLSSLYTFVYEPASMDNAEFHAAVYDLVRRIPTCRVTSYGHIAKLIGMPSYSRHVGQALKFLPPNPNPPIPWHRVISASGTISSRGPGTTGAQRQRDALQAEGVEVTTGRTGEMRVNLSEFGWFPTIAELNLPLPQDDERQDDDDGS